jgi:5'-nucleotidase
MTVRRTFGAVGVALVLALFGAACSGGDDSADTADTTTTEATTTTAAAEVLTILVSNDDGVDAPGIDAVVRALSELPDTEVIVVAPLENQSGSGSKTTEGELAVTEEQTASGVPATAVAGFPADAVNWALDGGIEETPDLVVSGVNSGQNLGAVGDTLSGTIGAARAGAAKGIPALASSTAISEQADYDLAATYVVDWVEENRAALLAGELTGDDLLLQSINIPVCTTGELRGVIEVPVSTSSENAIADQDCTSTLEDPADDIIGFNNGFVVISDLTLQPRT